jgi:competence CoiA-like predicted nuclease
MCSDVIFRGIMENSLYQREIICTFDLKDESGFYYEERVLEWKQAAADRKLICMECGSPVYLAAGPIKEPYFAHYDLAECDYGNGQESEELRKGKRILYHLLKRSFPQSQVQARYRMDNGMYSTLYCRIDDQKALAVDFRLQNNSLEKFQLRDAFYQANNITPVYIMGIKQNKAAKQIDWYQNLIQASIGYLAFLDTENELLILTKSFGYRIGAARKFLICKKTYPIKELLLTIEGQIRCDFDEECKKTEQQIQKEKEEEQMLQKRIKEQKEEYERRLIIENERMSNYRKSMQLRQENLHIPETGEDYEKSEKDTGNLPGVRKQVSDDLNPVLLEKCRKMIEEGNAHLVSRKYYEAIMGEQEA